MEPEWPFCLQKNQSFIDKSHWHPNHCDPSPFKMRLPYDLLISSISDLWTDLEWSTTFGFSQSNQYSSRMQYSAMHAGFLCMTHAMGGTVRLDWFCIFGARVWQDGSPSLALGDDTSTWNLTPHWLQLQPNSGKNNWTVKEMNFSKWKTLKTSLTYWIYSYIWLWSQPQVSVILIILCSVACSVELATGSMECTSGKLEVTIPWRPHAVIGMGKKGVEETPGRDEKSTKTEHLLSAQIIRSMELLIIMPIHG